MIAKPYRRKYNTLQVTANTTKQELGDFIGCPEAVRTVMNGIGFCADTTLIMNTDTNEIALYPGTVLLKNYGGDIAIIDGASYNMLFYEEENT